MEEDIILNTWNEFYKHFQTNEKYSQVFADDATSDKHLGVSLLFHTGRSVTLSLFKNLGLCEIDQLKLNHILCELEEISLPKIILLYERYKSTSDCIENDVPSSEYVCESNTPLPRFDQSVENNKSELSNRVDLTWSGRIVKSSDEKKHEEEIHEDAVVDKTVDSNVNKHLDLSQVKLAPAKPKSRSKPKLERKREKCQIASLNNIFLTEKENNIPASVRRSSRSVKISSKFEGVAHKLLKTIKPEPKVDRDSESGVVEGNVCDHLEPSTVNVINDQENASDLEQVAGVQNVCLSKTLNSLSKPPLVCSVCYESNFDAENVLRDHWMQHSEAEKGESAFQCIVCVEKFKNYDSLCTHYLSHTQTQCQTVSDTDYHYRTLEKSPVKNKSDATSCPICRTILTEGQSLTSHMQVHIPHGGPFTCDMCGVGFPTIGLVKSHSLTHAGLEHNTTGGSICLLCGHSFNHDRQLQSHIKKKHKKQCMVMQLQYFQCQQCSKRFKTQEQLDFHSVRHALIKPFSCDTCGKGFLREKGLIAHQQMHKGGGSICDVCGKSFVNQRVLEDHSTIHTGKRPHVCDICGKTFRLLANLRYHKQCHNPSKRVQCPHCPKTFIGGPGFTRHIMQHTGKRPFSCPVCAKGFVQEHSLTKHMTLHSGENRHHCNICQRSFVDKWGLLKHSTIHTGERPHKCNVCGRAFRIKKGLEDHYKLHDRNLQLHCPLCPKSFVERRHLDHHLRVHLGEKAYVCEICGDRFVNSMSLKVHLRRHTGEKPYKCQYCDKTFNQHGTHAAHERFHRGDRPYTCDMCEAAFITKSQLTIHRRKHLNIRPFKCHQCDYAAITRSLLKVHMLKHSSDKPFRCSLCPAAFKRQNHLDVHFRKHQVKLENDTQLDGELHMTDGTQLLGGLDHAQTTTVTVVEVFQCSFCEATFSTEAALENHMRRHEIIVVQTGPQEDGSMFEIPVIEGAHGASSEVAYDIVLL